MSKDYVYTQDYVTYKTEIWTKFLSPFIGKPNVRYLEIGVFEGRSLIWMLENILTDDSSNAVAIDPFHLWHIKFKPFYDTFMHNLKISGLASKINFIQGFSQDQFVNLANQKFDIIYVDGHHDATQVLLDLNGVKNLLKSDGLLIIDDYLWVSDEPSVTTSPKEIIDIWFSKNPEFKIIYNGYFLIADVTSKGVL